MKRISTKGFHLLLAGVAVVLVTAAGVLWTRCGASCRPLDDTTPPTAVTDLTATAISGKNVQLSWTAHGDDGDVGRATFYEIRYATTPITDEMTFAAATLLEDSINPEYSLKPQNYLVQHIKPSTTYYFAMKIGDDVGNLSSLSNIVSATTPAFVQDVSELTLASAEQTALTVSWISPGTTFMDPDGVAFYDLRYATTPITNDEEFTNATEIPNMPVVSEEGVRQEVTVGNLLSGTTYYFAFHLHDDEQNTLELSTPKAFATLGMQRGAAVAPLASIGNPFVRILPSACTTDRKVELVIHAEQVKRYRIGSSPTLMGSSWEDYPLGENKAVTLDWSLAAGDGKKTVYVQFQGMDGELSDPVSDAVQLDGATLCRTASEYEYGLRADRGEASAETNPSCLSDMTHTTVEPYLVLPDGATRGWRDGYVRVTPVSDVETQYAFSVDDRSGDFDAVVHVVRAEHVIGIHVNSLRGVPNMEIHYRIDAADRKRLDDRILWKPANGSTLTEQTLQLTDFPEVCPSVLVPHPHPGDLFKSVSSEKYVLGSDFKRHPFPDESVFRSWFPDGATVLTIADYQLQTYPLGSPVTYRPGVGIYQIDDQPDAIFAISPGPVLHGVVDRSLAAEVFGTNGTLKVGVISPADVDDYIPGSWAVSRSDLESIRASSASATINYWGDANAGRYDLLTHALDIVDGRVQFVNRPFETLDPTLKFRILGKNGAAITAKDLIVEQEEPVHVIVVRDDLSYFTAVHPTEKNGVWTGKIHVPGQGFYEAFVDIVPANDSAIVLRAPLVVGTHPFPGNTLPEPNPGKSSYLLPYSVTLHAEKWETGKELVIEAYVNKNGKPYSGIERYPEGYGQFVYFKQHDRSTFLHTHALAAPELGSNVVTFRARFPTPGRYTSFIDIQLDGALWTFPLTFDVP